MSEYKRKYRALDDSVKMKISQSLKGKKKSYWHRQHLSQSLKRVWDSIPSKYGNDNNSVKSSKSDEQ